MISEIVKLLFVAGTALAHSGHGETAPYSLTHAFVEPEHAVWIAALIAGAVTFFVSRKRGDARRRS